MGTSRVLGIFRCTLLPSQQENNIVRQAGFWQFGESHPTLDWIGVQIDPVLLSGAVGKLPLATQHDYPQTKHALVYKNRAELVSCQILSSLSKLFPSLVFYLLNGST